MFKNRLFTLFIVIALAAIAALIVQDVIATKAVVSKSAKTDVTVLTGQAAAQAWLAAHPVVKPAKTDSIVLTGQAAAQAWLAAHPAKPAKTEPIVLTGQAAAQAWLEQHK